MKLPNKSHLTANNSPNSIYVKTFFSDLEGKFTRIGDFTWRLSDSVKNLVGGYLQGTDGVGFMEIDYWSNHPFINFPMIFPSLS